MTTTTQINVRLSDKMLNKAGTYAKKHGFSNIQELIKETLREKLFGGSLITKEELVLVKKLAHATDEKGLWKSENELFNALDR